MRKPGEKRESPESAVLTREQGQLFKGRRLDEQLTLMNVNVARTLCGDDTKLSQFGDNLLVDFDLTEENLAPGSTIHLGQATLEITGAAHNGCAKFARRFGQAALRVVNLKDHRALRLRGVKAFVKGAGRVSIGDSIKKIEQAS